MTWLDALLHTIVRITPVEKMYRASCQGVRNVGYYIVPEIRLPLIGNYLAEYILVSAYARKVNIVL